MNSIMRSYQRFQQCAVLLLTLVFVAGAASLRAAVAVGDIAANFTINNHATGQPLRLYDYQGSVILLDFWAYWCGPCASAAQDMEPNIVQYYRNAGGNSNGVPVTVISISIDPSDPAAVNNFIASYGLELVGDDVTYAAFGPFSLGYIPHMAVINGTTNSTNYRAWEVLYSTYGYSRDAIKAKIDAVQTPAPVCSLTAPLNGAVLASNVTLNASVATNGKIIRKVEFYSGATLLGSDTNAPHELVWATPPAGAKTISARAHYGTGFSVNSASVSFTVGTPPPVIVSLCPQGANCLLNWTGCPAWYQIQMATNFPNPIWRNLGGLTTNLSLPLTPSNHAGFYRVRVER
jgi:thiol-disulfide isomerase/thioredoxin